MLAALKLGGGAFRQPYQARSAAEYVPWEEELLPGIICTKDLDLLVVYEYEGTDVDGQMQQSIDAMAGQFEKALGLLDADVAIWTGAFRRRSTEYPHGRFSDEFAASVDGAWKKQMTSGSQYSNLHLVAFTLSHRGARGSFLSQVRKQVEAGSSVPSALWRVVSASLSETQLEREFATQFRRDAGRLQDIAASVLGAVPQLKAVRLTGEALRSALKFVISPASAMQPVRESRLEPLLDSYLPDNKLAMTSTQMVFSGPTSNRHAAAISIKDWPDSTQPGLIDALLALPVELSIAQTFKTLSQSQAKRFIDDKRRYNQQRRTGLKDALISVITKRPISHEDSDQGRVHNIGEAMEALSAMRAERRVYGFYNLSLIIFGDTAAQCEEAVRLAVDVVQAQGYVCLREGVGMLRAFMATLPGRHEEIQRWHFANTGHVADLAFTRTISIGKRQSDYLTEQLGRRCAALTLFPTEYSTPFSYDMLHGQVGHTFIVGPPGAGKTVLTNFMAMQFMRYGDVNVIRFDKDYSCYIPTLLTGGSHIDLTSGDVKLNPWRLVRQPNHRAWLARFAKTLIEANGYQWTADDDVAVKRALDALATLPEDQVCIDALADSLGSERLRRQLAPWLPGGSQGALFSSIEDNFEVSSNTCIEMGNLLLDRVAAPRLIDYLTYRVRMLLEQQTIKPTFIDIQEAWAFLADPLFRKEIENWLKTLRKKNGSVFMSTQSVQDASMSEIFATIGDSMPTRIFLPNRQARSEKWRQIYTEALGLNDAQLSRITEGTDYQDFYLVRGDFSRMLMFRLPPHILAGLRSDKRALAVFRKHMPTDPRARRDWEWKQRYVDEVISAA